MTEKLSEVSVSHRPHRRHNDASQNVGAGVFRLTLEEHSPEKKCLQWKLSTGLTRSDNFGAGPFTSDRLEAARPTSPHLSCDREYFESSSEFPPNAYRLVRWLLLSASGLLQPAGSSASDVPGTSP
jgi:hypothetical protein